MLLMAQLAKHRDLSFLINRQRKIGLTQKFHASQTVGSEPSRSAKHRT